MTKFKGGQIIILTSSKAVMKVLSIYLKDYYELEHVTGGHSMTQDLLKYKSRWDKRYIDSYCELANETLQALYAD